MFGVRLTPGPIRTSDYQFRAPLKGRPKVQRALTLPKDQQEGLGKPAVGTQQRLLAKEASTVEGRHPLELRGLGVSFSMLQGAQASQCFTRCDLSLRRALTTWRPEKRQSCLQVSPFCPASEFDLDPSFGKSSHLFLLITSHFACCSDFHPIQPTVCFELHADLISGQQCGLVFWSAPACPSTLFKQNHNPVRWLSARL